MLNAREPDPSHQQRKREAARLIRRLDEDPNDLDAKADLKAFLARGNREREVYERMLRALNLARQKLGRRSHAPLVIALCAMLVAGALFYDDVRIRVLADHITGSEPQEILLPTGDRAMLDASSALADKIDKDTRKLAVVDGAGYFVVTPDPRPFVVDAGPLVVKALSTEFEVSTLDDDVLVAVFEGSVEVRYADTTWRLDRGERLIWSDGTARSDSVGLPEVAAWREDKVILDGMTFGQVIAMIDRRLPEDIVVLGASLADIEVAGRLDLSRPRDALQTLAAISDLRVRQLPPLVTVIHQ